MVLALEYKKCLFFRDDDIAELNPNLIRLIDIFVSHGIPIHLSVIPERLTRECRDYLVKRTKTHADLIEIGQHGFSHLNHSGSSGKLRQYEFGRRRTYKDQSNDIANGNRILKRSFKRKIDIFTPPWHGFDDNTLKALNDQGFRGLSVDQTRRKALSNGLKDLSICIDYNKRGRSGKWFTQKNAQIIKRIAVTKDPRIGILLHHNAFNGTEDFNRLEKLLKFIKQDAAISCEALSRPLKSGNSDNKIKQGVLAYYLNYQFVPKPQTLVPGRKNIADEKFDFNFRNTPKVLTLKESEICDQLYDKFARALEKQLPPHGRPIGVLLSGGMDSAAMLHVLRDITDRTIYTLTGAYRKDAGHLKQASKVAKKYDTIHSSLVIGPEDMIKIDELYKKKIPHPIGDNGFLSTYLMMKKLKENVDHIYSGDGADCLFCGLKMHRMNYVQKRSGGKKEKYAHYRFGEIFLNEEDLKTVFEKVFEDIKLETPLKKIMQKITSKDPLKRQVLLDLDFLVKNRVDYIVQAARASGTNVHLPYLDKSFVCFALSIPSKYLIRSSTQKYILKKTFEGRLPGAVLDRSGEGFTPPFRYWYSMNKEFFIMKLIKCKKLGITSAYIKKLINEIKSNNSYELGMRIWLLMNLASWYEHSCLLDR